jgi:hypothetical protein
MRHFVIEAYGGPHATNAQIVRFSVVARSAADAVEIVRRESGDRRYDRFEIVAEGEEFA